MAFRLGVVAEALRMRFLLLASGNLFMCVELETMASSTKKGRMKEMNTRSAVLLPEDADELADEAAFVPRWSHAGSHLRRFGCFETLSVPILFFPRKRKGSRAIPKS